MATGGDDPKKPSPLKTLFNLGRSLTGGSTSPEVFKDALSDLKPSDRKTSVSTLDPKQSKPDLKPASRKGSMASIKTVDTGIPSNLPNVASGSVKNSGEQTKGKKPMPKTTVEIEMEEPHLVEEISDDDNEPEALNFDLNLLDPERPRNEDGIHTLAFIFPKVQLKPEDLAKDPEPTVEGVEEQANLVDSDDIAEYIEYYQDLCRHRRKIYIHAGLLLRKLKKKEYTANELEDLLYYAENSKKVLDFVHEKLTEMYEVTSGQRRSYSCGTRNLVQSIDELKKLLETRKEAEREEQKELIRLAEADRAAAEEARVKAEHEKEKALSQINALHLARQTASSNPVVNNPPNVNNSMPAGSGAGTSGYQPGTGANAGPNNDGTTPRRDTSRYFRYGNWSGRGRGGGGERGGRTPDQGRGPPFRLSQNEDINDLIRGLSDVLKARQPQDDKPDYRGIEKTKLDFFSGDASVYAHWKKKFLLVHSSDRNLPNSYLANALHNLLKGEARKYVEAHFTADWTGDNYERMWEQLDQVYGSKHTQDRCIQDRAAMMSPLDQENLKTVEKFYIGVTVQINYYRVHHPEAVLLENSLLYQQMRQKISEELFIKFVDWTKTHSVEEFGPRSLMTLQAWLSDRLETLREVDTFNTSSRLRSSKSPSRSTHTGTSEQVEDESDSDTDPTHSVLQIDNTGKKVLFNKYKNKVFRYKPFAGEYKSPETLSSKRTTKPASKSYDQSFETNDTLCPICRDVSHELSTCSKFRRLTTYKRYAIVRRSRACFHCLNRGHPMHSCEVNKGVPCGVDGCKRYENPLLHADETTKRVPYQEWNDVTHGELVWNDNDGNVEEEIPSRAGFNTVMKLAKPGSVGIQTVVCNLSGPGHRRSMRTIAMLDSGADQTYIDEQTAIDLNMRQVSEPVSAFINQFEGRVEIKTWQVEVHLTSIDGFVSQTIHAWTKKDLTDKTGVVDWDKAKRNFKHIKDVPFEKLPRDARIRILIGTENSFLFAPEEGSLHTGGRGEPNAYLCVLGWTCYGPSQKLETKLEDMVHSLMPSQIPRNK